MNATSHRSLGTASGPEARAASHRIPGLFDFPQAGHRRRSTVLSQFVESLVAPQRHGQRPQSTLSGVK